MSKQWRQTRSARARYSLCIWSILTAMMDPHTRTPFDTRGGWPTWSPRMYNCAINGFTWSQLDEHAAWVCRISGVFALCGHCFAALLKCGVALRVECIYVKLVLKYGHGGSDAYRKVLADVYCFFSKYWHTHTRRYGSYPMFCSYAFAAGSVFRSMLKPYIYYSTNTLVCMELILHNT